jgi:hypothetical protein
MGPKREMGLKRVISAVLTVLALSVALACGGSSSNAGSSQTPPPPPPPPDVTITVNPNQATPISPWIYGINFYTGLTGAPPRINLDRAGGNRWTAYNWETNASNAGSDYLYQNDNYLSSSTTPAEAIRSIVAADQGLGMASVMTVQMQGLVAGDEAGPVSVANPPDMTRFKTVVDKKSTVSSAPFTITPPTTDAYVFMDEFLWAMDQKFTGLGIFGKSPAIPTFVSLDNEPELWNSTHLEVQGSTPVSSDNYITKTITLTEALKDQFPNVQIFGPVHYGFEGIYNWQGELSATPDGVNWFPDKYLPAIQAASNTYGRPLIDVYDFHWYSEATDGTTRVISMTSASLTDTQVQAVVQSPRSLWDPTFTENSWITADVLNEPIQILPRLQSKINAEFPGTKFPSPSTKTAAITISPGPSPRPITSASSAARECTRQRSGLSTAPALTSLRAFGPSAASTVQPQTSAIPRCKQPRATCRMWSSMPVWTAPLPDASCSWPSTVPRPRRLPRSTASLSPAPQPFTR